jgi:hypothetical protein
VVGRFSSLMASLLRVDCSSPTGYPLWTHSKVKILGITWE